MQQALRERGPGLLVPLAWFVVGAAHVGVVSERAIFVAHLVMVAFMAFFLVTGRDELTGSVLRGWQAVIAVGLVVTALGAVGFVVSSAATALWTISIGGWMLLPAVGLAYTAALMPTKVQRIYIWSATISFVGLVMYFTAVVGNIDVFPVIAIAVVGVGQSMGILDAIARA